MKYKSFYSSFYVFRMTSLIGLCCGSVGWVAAYSSCSRKLSYKIYMKLLIAFIFIVGDLVLLWESKENINENVRKNDFMFGI